MQNKKGDADVSYCGVFTRGVYIDISKTKSITEPIKSNKQNKWHFNIYSIN